jgi:hypothetical protein
LALTAQYGTIDKVISPAGASVIDGPLAPDPARAKLEHRFTPSSNPRSYSMSSEAAVPSSSPEPNDPVQRMAGNTAPGPATPRFDTEPFRPEGGIPPLGLVLTMGGSLLSALLIGSVVGYVAQWLYLVLLFPAAMGLGVGAATSFAVKRGKVRNPLIAGLAGGIGGALVMLSMHYEE